jgi:hypothetical protein
MQEMVELKHNALRQRGFVLLNSTDFVEKLLFGHKSNYLRCFKACNVFGYEGAYHKRVLVAEACAMLHA